MTIRITQYQSPPGTAGWEDIQFLGGDMFVPTFFEGDMLKTTTRKIVLDGGGFTGLKAVLLGDFTFSGDEVFGQIDRIKFSYEDRVFQDWRNVNWDIDDVGAAIDRFDAGDATAIQDFVLDNDFQFTLAKGHSGHLMTTDGDDTIVAQRLSDPDTLNLIQSFGGADVMNLRKMKVDTYIDSGAGGDQIDAGSGSDQIRSGAGNDVIRGGRGGDNIDGQGGRDKIYGEGGADPYLTGGRGNDKIWGGRGDDSIGDIWGQNKMYGGAGNDEISGKGLLNGGTGDDRLTGDVRNGDVFDFRLGSAKGFGDDKVSGNFSLSTKKIDKDEIWFDEGVEVTLRQLPRSGDVLLTADLDGVEIGTVRFDYETVRDIEDALVFL